MITKDELPIIFCKKCRKEMTVLCEVEPFMVHCLNGCRESKSIGVYHLHRDDNGLGIAEEILLQQYEDSTWIYKKDMMAFFKQVWERVRTWMWENAL